jgi:hypothetical protein
MATFIQQASQIHNSSARSSVLKIQVESSAAEVLRVNRI